MGAAEATGARNTSPPSSGLLERAPELAAIDAALSAAREGEGRLLYVEAHAGIGKSRLLAAASERGLEAGMEVLAAKGSELEREHSFGLAICTRSPHGVDLMSDLACRYKRRACRGGGRREDDAVAGGLAAPNRRASSTSFQAAARAPATSPAARR